MLLYSQGDFHASKVKVSTYLPSHQFSVKSPSRRFSLVSDTHVAWQIILRTLADHLLNSGAPALADHLLNRPIKVRIKAGVSTG